MSIPNTTYRILVEKLGDADPNEFIGNEGEVFYDPNSPELKLSNGESVGGLTISGQTNISYIVSTRTINSSTGIGTEIPLVTTTNPGLASTTDKEKIDASASIGLAAGLSIALG